MHISPSFPAHRIEYQRGEMEHPTTPQDDKINMYLFVEGDQFRNVFRLLRAYKKPAHLMTYQSGAMGRSAPPPQDGDLVRQDDGVHPLSRRPSTQVNKLVAHQNYLQRLYNSIYTFTPQVTLIPQTKLAPLSFFKVQTCHLGPPISFLLTAEGKLAPYHCFTPRAIHFGPNQAILTGANSPSFN